jgi:hypothetical protein
MSRTQGRISRAARGVLIATVYALLTLVSTSAAAVITYVGKASAADTSGSTRVVLTPPAGSTTDDLMVVGIAVQPGITITSPADWILIRNDVGNDPSQYTHYKFRTLGELAPSYTFTFSGSSQGSGGMTVFRGVDLISPIEANSGSSFPAGKGNLKITKPLAKVTIDLCVDLDGASPTDNTCIASVPASKPWLQWNWSGAAFAEDPKARASFGVFKTADEFIYLRGNF